MREFEEIKEKIEGILSTVKEKPININYWTCYKKIKKLDFSKYEIPNILQIKIALLSSFSIEPLAVYLDIECRKMGLFPEIYIGGFNQFRQEILEENSEFYKFKPEITILAVNLNHLLGDFDVNFLELSIEEKHNLIERTLEDIKNLITKFKEKSSDIFLINNFIEPTNSPFGIIDNKQELGFKEFYQIINKQLINIYKKEKMIYIFDLNKVASSFGISNVINYKLYYMASSEFSEHFLPYLIKEYMSYIKAFKGIIKKCIVLDLDNTLWGGIIGEDGFNGIKLNNSHPGIQFVDFQKVLLKLNKRGILLAINSKNNYDDAIDVIKKHPFMVLREENFASIMINWDNKAKNILKIAEDIGIGLDTLVFIDDNPVERDLIKNSLPEVLVVDLPKSSSLYKKTLEDLNIFNTLSVTTEDKDRAQMYNIRKKRKELERSFDNIDKYLESLEIRIKIEEINDFSLPRISNLIMKTNQFNLTTKRYSKKEIIEFSKKNNYKIYSLSVKDKFGDEGIVGVVIIEIINKIGIIDTLLMSCRVIGRKIEDAFLHKVIENGKENGIDIIKGKYINTNKNDLVSNFYKSNGFNLEIENEKGSEWILEISKSIIKIPKHITLEDQ